MVIYSILHISWVHCESNFTGVTYIYFCFVLWLCCQIAMWIKFQRKKKITMTEGQKVASHCNQLKNPVEPSQGFNVTQYDHNLDWHLQSCNWLANFYVTPPRRRLCNVVHERLETITIWFILQDTPGFVVNRLLVPYMAEASQDGGER